ncbi:MAG: hypothetical protein Q4F43_02465 [Eubacteriales bacterium]|nr:hypothetical protein [Eubacteriales bacterium]
MKKTRSIWISMLLVMIFTASLCTSVYANVDMTLALEKVGEIQEAKLDYKNIEAYPSGLITEDTEGNYYVLDEMGNNNLGRSYGKVVCFSEELFLVYDAETWPNSCGLVKADGTVVLPCEAAIIDPVKGSDRYLKVSVATEPTDKENAFLYTYSGWVAWPEEQSEYYDGYAHYYDLKEGKYFENWDEADLSEMQGIYNKKKLDNDKYAITATDGTVITEVDFYPNEIYGEGELFSIRQDDGYIVVNRKGDPVSDIKFKAPPTETNGYLWAVNVKDEEERTVIGFDGKIYADAADKIWNVLGIACGFTLLYNKDDNSLLLYPDGIVAKLGKYDNDGNMPFYRWQNDGEPDSIFVLKKGKYQEIEEKIVNTLDSSLMLLAKKDGETEYSIYNTIDGSILLKKAGTKVYGSDYWVYVLKNGVWEVYKVIVRL